MPSLTPHPRLYLGPATLERVRQPPRLPLLRAAQQACERKAEQAVLSTEFDFGAPSHNDLLIRARRMQGRLLALLVRWEQTGEPRFRAAVLAHVRAMAAWRHWSWIAMREGKDAPDAIFDLSYGENAASLALAYSWLHRTLTPDERELFVAQARDRALAAFLAHTPPDGQAWWFGRKDSNWNTVCAGGAGMLALAMMEELPDQAAATLERVEVSIAPFIAALRETGGGWPEGIGYWNYGFRYAFMYLLSWEQATGRRHPLLEVPELAVSLGFNQAFCPNGVPCSFGDVNHWTPEPFHFAACRRLGRDDLIADLTARSPTDFSAKSWPTAEELLLLHPGDAGNAAAPQPGFTLHCRGLDWVALADRFPQPHLYLSVRGGTTEVPHGHMDLLSYHLVVEDEAMISNLGVGEYLDTTFSSRRYELFETTPPSKNTILVNGVGIARPSRVDTALVAGAGVRGVRLDASGAMGESRNGAAVRFCGRLILLLHEQAVLVLDRVVLPFPARVESRQHSFATPTVGEAQVGLRGKRQHLSLRYAADQPALLATARNAPTTPTQEGAHVLRWCSRTLVSEAITLATLMLPGEQDGQVGVTTTNDLITVRVQAAGFSLDLRVDGALRLV